MQQAGRIRRLLCSRALIAIAAMGFVSLCANASAQAPLIQQVFVAPDGVGFVEIANLSEESISLDDFYLATAPDYHKIVLADDLVLDEADFLLRFPEGTMLAPGGLVIQLSGTGADFVEAYAQSPDLSVHDNESEESARMIAVVDVAEGAGPGREAGLLVLFSWDGASDTVQDSDIVAWGDTALVDKTGLSSDGPDEGDEATAYLDDTAEGEQRPAAAPADGEALARVDGEEDETVEGGNGIDGHDETSEDLASAFASAEPSLGEVVGAVSISGVVSVMTGQQLTLDGLVITVDEIGTSQTLDESGEFSLEVPEAGDYTLIVTGAGVSPNEAAVTVPEEGIEGVEIVLEVGFTLSGVVSAADTMAGLEGATVTLSGSELSELTAEGGAYAFEALSPGVYTLSFEAEGYLSASRTVEVSQDLELDVTLSLEARHTLTLTINTPDGAAAGAAVTAIGGLLGESGTATADAGGVVTLADLLAGNYSVSISHEGHDDLVIETIPLTQDASLVVMLVPETRQPIVTDKGCATSMTSGSPSGSSVPMWALAMLVGLVAVRRRR